MKISLATWLEFSKRMGKLFEALDSVQHGVHIAMLGGDLDDEDKQFLKAMGDSIENSRLDFLAYDVTPQSEWPGGPSTGPDALPTKLRYPRHRFIKGPIQHFTKAEIKEAKDLGLLDGHYGGPE